MIRKSISPIPKYAKLYTDWAANIKTTEMWDGTLVHQISLKKLAAFNKLL